MLINYLRPSVNNMSKESYSSLVTLSNLTLCALPVNKIASNNLLNEIQDITLSYQTAELCTVL